MGKEIYQNGLITCSVLDNEEIQEYSAMPVGVTQTSNMFRSVAENNEEKQIIEIKSDGINRIRIRKVSPIMCTTAQGVEFRCGRCRATLWVQKDTASLSYNIKHHLFCHECGTPVLTAETEDT